MILPDSMFKQEDGAYCSLSSAVLFIMWITTAAAEPT